MRLFARWLVASCFLWLPFSLACGQTTSGGLGSAGGGGGDDGGSTGFGDNANGRGSSGFGGGGGTDAAGSAGPCQGGHYEGTFAGSYSSHLALGFPVPVTGNVDLTLNQAGSAGMQCVVAGEFLQCNDVFELQGGIITGVADKAMIDDASIGGFPYFCTMTGTLDCQNKKLVGGWIQCTYCVGSLADGGMACDLLNGVGGTTGVGGHFAGPLTADYDVGSQAFVNGVWNGAEALAGNDGGSPGPDGAPIDDYLTDSGLYTGGNFGGVGTWNATHQ